MEAPSKWAPGDVCSVSQHLLAICRWRADLLRHVRSECLKLGVRWMRNDDRKPRGRGSVDATADSQRTEIFIIRTHVCLAAAETDSLRRISASFQQTRDDHSSLRHKTLRCIPSLSWQSGPTRRRLPQSFVFSTYTHFNHYVYSQFVLQPVTAGFQRDKIII